MQESMYDDDLTDCSEPQDVDKNRSMQQLRRSSKTPKAQGSTKVNPSLLIRS